MKEFRAFVLRGNVVDLAIGVVIGAAFGAVVTSLVKDVLTPLLGLLHVPDFAGAAVRVGTAQVRYGAFINAVLSFLIVAIAVYVFVVKPVNRLMARVRPEQAPDAPTRTCPQCLSSIPAAAQRCAFCTQPVSSSTT